MTANESRTGTGRLSVNRRTALQMAGVGLAGSALFSGGAAAGGRWDALVLLVNSNLAGPGKNVFGNITKDDDGNELMLDGAVLFDKRDGADATGGGPFSLAGPGVTNAVGEWEATEAVRSERYGSFPASHPSRLPQAVKGGLVELEVTFDPSIDGVGENDTLIIECGVGTHDGDDPEFGSGFFIGDYTDVDAAFNLFNYP